MDSIKCGMFIKEKRKELDLTQKDLADKLNCTDKAISRWETGKGFPEVSFLIPLSKILNVSVNEILIGESIKQDAIIEKANEIIVDTITESDKRIIISNKIVFAVAVIFNFVLSLVMAITATPSDAMAVPIALVLFSWVTALIVGILNLKLPIKLCVLPISIFIFIISSVLYQNGFVSPTAILLVYPLVIIITQSIIIFAIAGIKALISKIKHSK